MDPTPTPSAQHAQRALLDDLPLPLLPEITDAALARAALTHISTQDTARGWLGDYKKLAHVGKSLLGSVVAYILHEEFPDLTAFQITSLIGRLVDRSTLNAISERYALASRIVIADEARAPLSAGGFPKLPSQMFVAYIGAVYYSCQQPTAPGSAADQTVDLGQTAGDVVAEQEGTESGSKAKDSCGRTRGEAYDRLLSFLTPLFLPLARKVASQDPHSDPGSQERQKSAQEAVGGKSALHFFLALKGCQQPDYVAERVWPAGLPEDAKKGEEGMLFRLTGRVVLPTGKVV